jgi:HEAT repeat protein
MCGRSFAAKTFMGTDNDWNAEFRRALAARRAATRIIRTLTGMISSPQYDVRMEALEALCDCTFEIDLERSVRKRIRDRNELVRVTAIEVAGDHVLKSLRPEIIQRLKSDRSWLVRRAAAVALGDLSAVEARKILVDRIHLVGEAERVGLYYALVKLGVRKYLVPFSRGLSNVSYLIRCATANLIPGIADRGNKRRWIRLLNDESSLESTLKELGY